MVGIWTNWYPPHPYTLNVTLTYSQILVIHFPYSTSYSVTKGLANTEKRTGRWQSWRTKLLLNSELLYSCIIVFRDCIRGNHLYTIYFTLIQLKALSVLRKTRKMHGMRNGKKKRYAWKRGEGNQEISSLIIPVFIPVVKWRETRTTVAFLDGPSCLYSSSLKFVSIINHIGQSYYNCLWYLFRWYLMTHVLCELLQSLLQVNMNVCFEQSVLLT